MKKFLSLYGLLILSLKTSQAQHPVVLTEDALTLGKDSVDAGVGVEYRAKQEAPEPDLHTSELRLFVLAAHFGVAENVNFDLDWRGRLVGRTKSDTHASDWGDLSVATKINLLGERTLTPALGIRTAVKLPNTSYLPNKLGSDQTDFYFSLLASKSFASIVARLNLGLGILGNPRAAGSQDDIYIVSGTVIVPLFTGWSAFVETYGFTGYKEDDDKFLGRLGIWSNILGMRLNAYGSFRIAGNNRDFSSAFESSEDWSAGLFLMRSLQF